eukprot:7421452-Pyramimonas_sp.AAC.1
MSALACLSLPNAAMCSSPLGFHFFQNVTWAWARATGSSACGWLSSPSGWATVPGRRRPGGWLGPRERPRQRPGFSG